MRKLIGVGLVALIALVTLVTASGVIFAQEDDTPPVTWLGIRVFGDEDGVFVHRVFPTSPAAEAGVEVGDRLVSVDGSAIETVEGLVEAIQSKSAGDVIAMLVERDGEEINLTVTLASAPDLTPTAVEIAEMLLHAGLTPVEGGYQVALVGRQPFSDLQEGDILTAINGQAVETLAWDALQEAWQEAETPALTLSVLRAGEEISIEWARLGRGGMLGNPAGMPGFMGPHHPMMGPRGGREGNFPGGQGEQIRHQDQLGVDGAPV